MFRSSPSRHSGLPIRGSTRAAWAVGLAAAVLALLWLDAPRLAAARAPSPAPAGAPALFNEARYARHAGLSEPLAAFQDHPLALEHFPSGSLMPPPRPDVSP